MNCHQTVSSRVFDDVTSVGGSEDPSQTVRVHPTRRTIQGEFSMKFLSFFTPNSVSRQILLYFLTQK